MRESPWRSLALPLFVAAGLAIWGGACGPRFDVNNSPPPCLKGYKVCPISGACQPVNPKDTSDDALPLNCEGAGAGTMELRQGTQIVLNAPGARPEDLTIEAVDGDKLTAAWGKASIQSGARKADDGRIGILITAPHGTDLGDAFNGKTRIIKITTKIGNNDPFVRKIPIIVSSITAAGLSSDPMDPSNGDDDGPGTFGHPFVTFQQAVSVAGAGDTIYLRNIPPPKDHTRTGPGDNATTAVALPDGITVRCPDADQVSLKMPVTLAGDATLDTLRFEGPRLDVTQPGSHVTFVNDILEHGLTVDGKAGVAPGAPGTTININSTSQIFDDRAPDSPARSPLLVDANGASITIDDSGINMTDESPQGAVETLRIDGNGVTLTLSGGTGLSNAAGQPGLHVTNTSSVSIMGAKFFADLLVENSDTDVAVSNATFDRAALRFSGHDLKILNNTLFTDYDANFIRPALSFQGNDLQIADTIFDTRGIVLPLPAGQNVVQIMAGAHNTTMENVTFKNAPLSFEGQALVITGSTSFTGSLLTFRGSSLSVTDATFSGQGIDQEAADSTATLNNVSITNYTQYGYKLGTNGGQVSITGGSFTHDPAAMPVASADPCPAPWALLIEADSDTSSAVASRMVQYDGQLAVACEVVGPGCSGSLFSITTPIKIDFY
jgi:hypothetical protein